MIVFYLIADSIDHEALNAQLGVQSIVSITKGDPRIYRPTGKVHGFYAESTWGFSSAQAIESDELDDHANWLLSKVSGSVEMLRSDKVRKAFIEITVITEMHSGSLVLPVAFLALATDLNAEIGAIVRYKNLAA